jgi:hypothetical protein
VSDVHGSHRTLDTSSRILRFHTNRESSLLPSPIGTLSSTSSIPPTASRTSSKRTRSKSPTSDSDRGRTTSDGRAVQFHVTESVNDRDIPTGSVADYQYLVGTHHRDDQDLLLYRVTKV